MLSEVPEEDCAGAGAERFRMVAIGGGPANLSLMCLAEALGPRFPDAARRLFHDRADVSWHAGQLSPGVTMLSEFFWDLVTPVSPRSRFSFLSYLKQEGRLQAFLNTGVLRPCRIEFSRYFQWAAEQIPEVEFLSPVVRVHFCAHHQVFHLAIEGARPRCIDSENVVIGIGSRAKPDLLSADPRVVGVGDLAEAPIPIGLREVAVVGAGQSAAEALLFLLDRLPEVRRFVWVCPDYAPRSVDTSPLRLDLFLDAGIDHAFGRADGEQTLGLEHVSGVDPDLARTLIARQYQMSAFEGRSLEIARDFRVTGIERRGEAGLVIRRDDGFELPPLDLVVVADGRTSSTASAMELLSEVTRAMAESIAVGRDYGRDLGRGCSRQLFLQSANEVTHGFSDRNFVTAPIRNARILASLLKLEVRALDAVWT